jgi:hypothetical protein
VSRRQKRLTIRNQRWNRTKASTFNTAIDAL